MLGLIALAGESPLRILAILIGEGFLNRAGIADSLVRSIPLTLAGLGVVLAFRAGVFNIGVEGQLLIGAALAVACAPILSPLPSALSLPLLLLAGTLGGAVWGGIAGFLKARFGANEIIATIMLNYIAIQMVSWLIRGPLQEASGIFPRSDKLANSLRLPILFDGTRLSAGLIVAALACVAVWFLVARSRYGYALTVTGKNPDAARYGGIRPGVIAFSVLCLSGALAGLAGIVEVSGLHGRLQEGFVGGIGITAIAVALLARLNPIWVPVAAFGFSGLYVGSDSVARLTEVPFPLVHVIEGMIVLAFLVLQILTMAKER
ncbi:ABC transporter permease [Salinihabitans flavidus]|uniref:ABC transporter permease n=1 Tax=Salinihabitans flavidus TaxID=569882 RepID=UPI001587B104|nr:ABC transporter permease [Salinihabitans flavidus]